MERIDSLIFNYQHGKISSVRVVFDEELEDSILISKKYINELRNYFDISEEDKGIYFIIARAIQLKKENSKVIDGAVKKYKFSDFHKVFIEKLIELSKIISIDIIASYFGYDAKVEDLDVFLNKASLYTLALVMKSGAALNEYDVFSEEDDDFE